MSPDAGLSIVYGLKLYLDDWLPLRSTYLCIYRDYSTTSIDSASTWLFSNLRNSEKSREKKNPGSKKIGCDAWWTTQSKWYSIIMIPGVVNFEMDLNDLRSPISPTRGLKIRSSFTSWRVTISRSIKYHFNHWRGSLTLMDTQELRETAS